MARYKVLGITQDKDSCDCCGRTNLKKTVILGALDSDNTVSGELYYGISCAATALGRTGKSANTKVENEAASAQIQRTYATAKVRELEAIALDRDAIIDWIGRNNAPRAKFFETLAHWRAKI